MHVLPKIPIPGHLTVAATARFLPDKPLLADAFQLTESSETKKLTAINAFTHHYL